MIVFLVLYANVFIDYTEFVQYRDVNFRFIIAMNCVQAVTEF